MKQKVPDEGEVKGFGSVAVEGFGQKGNAVQGLLCDAVGEKVKVRSEQAAVTKLTLKVKPPQ